jgi:hypothetical protein
MSIKFDPIWDKPLTLGPEHGFGLSTEEWDKIINREEKMKNLFQYAIIYKPKTEGGEIKSEILVDIKSILAKSEDEVKVLAARQIPEKFLDRLSDVVIIVRPF